MTSPRASFAYSLRKDETGDAASKRLGAGAARPLDGAQGVVELPVPLEGAPLASEGWVQLEAHLRARFAGALAMDTSTSNGVRTTRVKTEEETFDVVARGGKLFVLTFDGFGGVDALDGAAPAAFDRAYDAYRALLKARHL